MFEDHDPTNTLRARTLGAIALTPTGNAQGDYFFLSLATGHKISRHNWTAIPMTDTAIARVEALAEEEGQPLIQASGLVVEWRHDQAVDPTIYDLDYHPDDVDDVAFDANDYDAIDADELAALAAPPTVYENATAAAAHPQGANFGNQLDDDDEHHGTDDDYNPEGDDDDEDDDEDDGDDNEDDNNPEGPAPANNEAVGTEGGARNEDAAQEGGARDEDAAQGEGAPDEAAATGETAPNEAAAAPSNGGEGGEHTHNLRPRNIERSDVFRRAIDTPHSDKSYFPPRQLFQTGSKKRTKPLPAKKIKGKAKMLKRLRAVSPENWEKIVFGFIMNQMTAKAAIKKHGRAAEEALMKEFAQLENLEVYEAVDPTELTKKNSPLYAR